MKNISFLIICSFLAASLPAHAKAPAKEKKQEQQDPLLTIGGQVRAPGLRRYIPGMTLYQALQSAGGETEFGSVRRLSLTRDGKTEVIDLTKQENKALPAKPNDTIEIPQKNWIGR